MKNCRHCYSQIHDRASICHVCQNTVTFTGSIQSFLLTAFPILTALISLGFAFYEKYEKGLVQDTLASTEVRLEVAEVESEVAQEAAMTLSDMAPRISFMVQEPDVEPGGVRVLPKSREEQLSEIEEELEEVTKKPGFNKKKLSELYKKQFELQSDRPNLFKKRAILE